MYDQITIHNELIKLHHQIIGSDQSNTARKGVCMLYTEMAINAFLAGQYHSSFTKLMRFIYENRDNQPLLLASQPVIELIKNGDLYQNSAHHHALFGPLSSYPTLEQITAHIQSEGLKALGGRVIVGEFTNCYTPQDMMAFLTLFFNFSQQVKASFCLSLSSGDHRNGLCFDASSNEWLFIDANVPLFPRFFPVTQRDYLQNIANLLMSAFEEQDYTCFQSIMTTTGKQRSGLQHPLKNLLTQSLFQVAESKLSKKTSQGYDLLYKAVDAGDLELIKKIMAINSDLDLNCIYPQGQTLAIVASKYIYLPVLAYLAEIKRPDGGYSLDLNLEGGKGYAAAYVASAMGNLEIVNYLISLKLANGRPRVDFDRSNERVNSPLIASIITKHPEVLKVIIQAPRPAHKVRQLLNAKVYKDYTPIYLAVYMGREDLVSILIDASDADGNPLFDLDEPIDNDITPLFMAINGGHTEVVRMLLAATMPDGQARVNVHHRTLDDNMPIHVAATKGNLAIINLLVAAGADLHQSWNGLLPWEIAAATGHHAIADQLRSMTLTPTQPVAMNGYGFFQRQSSTMGSSAALLSGSSILQLAVSSSLELVDNNNSEQFEALSLSSIMISLSVSLLVLTSLIYFLNQCLSEKKAPSPRANASI